MVASPQDVEAALGRQLTDAEELRAERLLEEAGVLISSHTGTTYEGEAPRHVVIVASRMVARALSRPDGREGVQSRQETFGPFSHADRYVEGSTDGGVWLTSTDRQMLGAGRSGGIGALTLVSERYA